MMHTFLVLMEASRYRGYAGPRQLWLYSTNVYFQPLLCSIIKLANGIPPSFVCTQRSPYISLEVSI